NRALVIDYFNKNLRINGNSSSDDVVKLKQAIMAIGTSTDFDLGHGGTTFRFFIFLISRLAGSFTLNAHERLLQRPQQEITHVLKQLGVSAELLDGQWKIKSEGWKIPSAPIVVSAELSSQFVSGLLLSTWDLDFDLTVEVKKPVTSNSYLSMTIDMLQKSGMKIDFAENDTCFTYTIAKNQKAIIDVLNSELDISSAFSLAAAGVVNGDVQITNWNSHSSQPDLVFLEFFKRMNISYSLVSDILSIAKHNNWKSADFNLQNSPDLFPVLSVLTAFADGNSKLFGAEQLKHKESNRIQKTHELLSAAGFKSEVLNDGIVIHGKSSNQNLNTPILFNPDHDHRMAMAAALLKLMGYNIAIQSPEVVNKSYPNFWSDIGLNL
ncbi:MAG: 3-phosphoshikimate 1-carboxyvinyltransferase, partial [Pseudobdellovibrio sp.]